MPRRLVYTLVLAVLVALTATATASAETRIEKVLKLSPGGKFVLEADAGGVSITGTSTESAEVVITSKAEDLESKFDFKFEELPGEARVTARKKGVLSNWFGFFTSSLHFEIKVPTRTRVALTTGGGGIKTADLDGEAQLSTSGGSISVSRHAGKVGAKTSGGSIEVRSVQGDVDVDTSGGSIGASEIEGKLKAETSGGSIRIGRVTGDLQVGTSGGSIVIEDAGGRVAAETSGGSITTSFARGNERGGSLETSGGGIEVRIDPDANLNIEATASGGKVVSDLPVKVAGEIRRSSVSGTLGSGGATLTLHTSGGSVRIAPVQGGTR